MLELRLLIPVTVLICAICEVTCELSTGLSGSWLFIWATSSFRNVSDRFCALVPAAVELVPVAAAAAGEHPERLRSCGKATYAVRLGIMDDEGRLLPANQAGEIVARGSLVSPGYHNMPEATAEIRTFGWHHTGDVGYRDEDGYFYIVDRKKDMIISGGFNVYSGEVEAAIMEMPQVYECAVIGVPHETWGEAVKGLVVVRPGEQLTEDEVIAHCKKKLGSVKAPKTVEFRAEIPKTPAGKVDRKTLRAPYWKGAERGVH